MDKTEAVCAAVIMAIIASGAIAIAVAITNYEWRKEAVAYGKAEWVVADGQSTAFRWK